MLLHARRSVLERLALALLRVPRRVLATLGQELAGAGSLVAEAVQLSPHLLCVAVLADLEAVDHELGRSDHLASQVRAPGELGSLGFSGQGEYWKQTAIHHLLRNRLKYGRSEPPVLEIWLK